ncbi:SDR family NAD(P)-dependent oxidoreductase [Gemmatimonas groenlandica]|uniref:Probable oxidoreductase n=1 Tax=Gemmatimonas groenlandica TaxID=2732249 RepID=A0A6M4IVN9_9BACT|nr:SDR family NAD(P)-dependent oxidoreductase [Gemmatimonas groenlandica]QJR37677.1 SDR family NAD(P)-dependent oxidoreductase [Gemmatimonas groenlandica]
MHTPIRTLFGFSSTADDVMHGVDLTGKRALVTGGASGIGIETVRVLARAGAEVVVAVRRVEVGEAVASEIRSSTGNPRVHVAPLDLSDLRSVHAFAAGWSGPLHILVNNAGVMAIPTLERTSQGWEMQFATNFLGHFALTQGLFPAMASAGGARIVSVSSSGNLIAPVLFDDLHFDFMPYDPFVAYGQSKSACALLAVEATRRWSDHGIFANALNPGAIATNLQKHTGGLRTPIERQKSVAQGAATSILLAAHPMLEGIGGRYFEDCNEAATVTRRPADYSGVAHYAMNAHNAQRLWEIAAQLVL